MKFRTYLAALVVALVGLTTVPAAAPASPAQRHDRVELRHPCTRTSSGSCIQGGQFCPQASYGHNGWDARGRRYVCKGNHTHPHWMKP
ncbi:hypothetical protein [Nocardioides sp.]|uniref:hypothetical protein n=1 Tax=Nocardioides sp. TaxID=35761 RepID=UPI0031FF2DBA